MNTDSNISATFGGIEIAPGNLAFDGKNFKILKSWEHTSYDKKYGLKKGSTYFSIFDIAKHFDSRGDSFADVPRIYDDRGFIIGEPVKIDNAHTLNGWRIPSVEDWKIILTTDKNVRPGSTVNGQPNVHYAPVKIAGVEHGDSLIPCGILIFPDNKDIKGRDLFYMDKRDSTDILKSHLNGYLAQGCAFLSADGLYYEDEFYEGGYEGCYWASENYGKGRSHCLYFDEKLGPKPESVRWEEISYCSVRLIR